MSDTPLDRPLVLAMAQAGYEFMVKADAPNVPALHDPLLPWENQSDQLRADWEGCARAMLDVVVGQHVLMAPLAPMVAADVYSAPSVRRWLAVLEHPNRAGEHLYRIEYDASPREYEKGRAERARLIERVELPPGFSGGLLDAVQWWKARKQPPPAPAPEPAKEPAP